MAVVRATIKTLLERKGDRVDGGQQGRGNGEVKQDGKEKGDEREDDEPKEETVTESKNKKKAESENWKNVTTSWSLIAWVLFDFEQVPTWVLTLLNILVYIHWTVVIPVMNH